MLINRVGGGSGENVTAEVRTQTPLIEQLANLISTMPKPSATHLWAKFTEEDGTLMELLVSTQSDTYPNGVGEDGYYYQKIVYVVGTDEKGTYLLEL